MGSRLILTLRGLTERWAPSAWRERVLLPILADVEHESGAAPDRWRRSLVLVLGTWTFLRVFVYVSVVAGVEHVRRNTWTLTAADRRSARGVLRRALGATAIAVALFALISWPRIRWLPFEALALTLPSLVSVTLPLGMAFSFARPVPSEAGRRGPLTAALLAALLAFVVAAWLTPMANQACRERAVRAFAPTWVGAVERGDRELMLHELGPRAAELRSLGRARAAAELDLEWHKKGVLAVSVLVMALAGAAISSWRLPSAARLIATAGVFLFFFGLLRWGEAAADAGRLAPALAMWGPVAGLAMAAALAAVLAGGSEQGPRPPAGGDDSVMEDPSVPASHRYTIRRR